MKRSYIVIAALSIFSIQTATAQDKTYQDMQDAGFGDTAKLMQSMTPAQRQMVMQRAAAAQQNLQKLTPQQQEQLRQKLRTTQDTIQMDRIDPNKLNTSQIKTSQDQMKDLDTYQTKYQKGQLTNSAVKPNPHPDNGNTNQ